MDWVARPHFQPSPSLAFGILSEANSDAAVLKLRASLELARPGSATSSGASSPTRPSPWDHHVVHLPQQSTVVEEPSSEEADTGEAPHLAKLPSFGNGPGLLPPAEVLQELLGSLYIDVSRLEMGDVLGEGGFAMVRRATLTVPAPVGPPMLEPVAVKQLRKEALQGPQDLKEFLTEANLLRKLSHKHIVTLRGVGALELSDLVAMRESMFVVQELMDGGDLKALLMKQMVDPFVRVYKKSDALRWCMQISEAMQYLHCICKPMIIHRDLKLDNILLKGQDSSTSVAKLADFGLHKRVRKSLDTGALVPWDVEGSYHGNDYEPSYYGGKQYEQQQQQQQWVALQQLHEHRQQIQAQPGQLPPRPPSTSAASTAANGAAALAQQQRANGTTESPSCSDSAASLPHASAALTPGKTANAPQQPSASAMNAQFARQGNGEDDAELVTRMLSAAASGADVTSTEIAGPRMKRSSSVQRKLAAIKALDNSVRAGSAFYEDRSDDELQPQAQPQQQQQQQHGGHGVSQEVMDVLTSGMGSQKFINATQKVGSLLYMAPEVLTGNAYNEKVDVFAFGVILFELMSGQLLYSRIAVVGEVDNMLAYAQQVAKGHREDVPLLWPVELRELISACWHQEPAQRPSFGEVLKRLYRMQQAGVAEAMDAMRPGEGYNPMSDCGCCTIM